HGAADQDHLYLGAIALPADHWDRRDRVTARALRPPGRERSRPGLPQRRIGPPHLQGILTGIHIAAQPHDGVRPVLLLEATQPCRPATYIPSSDSRRSCPLGSTASNSLTISRPPGSSEPQSAANGRRLPKVSSPSLKLRASSSLSRPPRSVPSRAQTLERP